MYVGPKPTTLQGTSKWQWWASHALGNSPTTKPAKSQHPAECFPDHQTSTSTDSLRSFLFLFSLCHRLTLHNMLFISSFSPLEGKLLESRILSILFIVLDEEGLVYSTCSISIWSEIQRRSIMGTCSVTL